MPFKVDDEVELEMPGGTILNGVVKTVKITEETVRYAIYCISNGITYIVDEIRDMSESLQ